MVAFFKKQYTIDQMSREQQRLLDRIDVDKLNPYRYRRLAALAMIGIALFQTKGLQSASADRTSQATVSSQFHPDRYDLFKPDYIKTVSGPTSFLNGSVKIQGFNVAINYQNIADQLPNDQAVRVSLETSSSSKDARTKVVQNFMDFDADPSLKKAMGKDVVPEDSMGLGRMFATGSEINGGINYLIGGLRSVQRQTLEIDRYEVDSTGHLQLLSQIKDPIHFMPNEHCDDVPQSIISEVRLTGQNYERLCNYIGRVAGLIPDSFNLFVNNVTNQDSFNESALYAEREVTLNTPFMKDRKGHSPAYGTTLHEADHIAYVTLLERYVKGLRRGGSQPVGDLSDRILSAYALVWRSVNKGETEKTSTWSALTESTYESQLFSYKDSLAGHPWDNESEMLASTAAVLATYPAQFLARYRRLNKNQRYAVRNAVQVTLEMLSSVDTKDPLSMLIPSAAYIKSQLKIK